MVYAPGTRRPISHTESLWIAYLAEEFNSIDQNLPKA